MASEKVQAQATCVGASSDKRAVYAANAKGNANATPVGANRVAFTMISLECAGRTQEDAFKEMKSRHAEKDWYPDGLTLSHLTTEFVPPPEPVEDDE
tara:strand:+ start:11646 stop:11936 length:291 start_codon:yes stop_codon:yes gene_type:complete